MKGNIEDNNRNTKIQRSIVFDIRSEGMSSYPCKKKARLNESSAVGLITSVTSRHDPEIFQNDSEFQLNDKGIACMINGNVDEAENYFVLALSRLQGGYCPQEVLSKIRNNEYSADFNKTSVKQQGNDYFYDEGMHMHKEALPLKDKDVSMQSSTLLYNIGLTIVSKKFYKESKLVFESALQCLRKNKPENCVVESHDDRLIRNKLEEMLHHNIGNCLYRLGLRKEARSSYESALNLTKNVVPKVSDMQLLAAMSQNALGVIDFHCNKDPTDDKTDCLIRFMSCLEVYKQNFGIISTEVATIWNNIGRVYFYQGEYAEAICAYNMALMIRREKALTSRDLIVDVAATVCNAGQCYHRIGQYEQAKTHYKEFLCLAQTNFSANRRDIAIVLRCIAELYHDQNKFDEALKFYDYALQLGRDAVGVTHLDVITTLNKLGSLYYAKNQYDLALQYYNEGLIQIEEKETNLPLKLVAFANVAQIYRKQGKYTEALEAYSKVYKLQVVLLGPEHIEVGNTLSNIGFIHFHMKSYQTSIDLYQRTLNIQRKWCNGFSDSMSMAATLSSMALAAFSMGSSSMALEHFNESLRIRTTILGPDHVDLAILWYNIATIYLEQGDDDDALKFYKEALRLERLGATAPNLDVVVTLQHIGLVYRRLGMLDEALEYFTESFDLLTIMLSKGNENEKCIDIEKEIVNSIVRILNLIGNIYFQLGCIGKMMECFAQLARLCHHRSDHSDSLLIIVSRHCLTQLSKNHPPCAATA